MQPKRFALLGGQIATVKERTGTCPLCERKAAALACCRERESGWLMIEFAKGVMASCQEFFHYATVMTAQFSWKSKSEALSSQCEP